MVKFKISKTLKAGKVYYVANSSKGSIRRETLEELEEAIEEYNKREEKEAEGAGSESLEELGLSSRTASILADAGINTLGQLKAKSEEELGDIDGIGPKSVEEIEAVLELSAEEEEKEEGEQRKSPPTV